MELQEAYTTREISHLIEKPVQSVTRTAKRENWQSRPRQGRGGGSEWLFSSMPSETQLAIKVSLEKDLAVNTTANTLPAVQSTQTVYAYPVDESPKKLVLDAKRRKNAFIRADILKLYMQWQSKHGSSVAQKDAFVEAFAAGAWPQLLEELGSVPSWKSLERWKLQEKTDGVLKLADKRGLANRGNSLLSEAHKTLILAHILDPNQPKIAQCVRQIQLKCKAKDLFAPSESTIRRFVETYVSTCFDEYTLWSKGKKAWNDQCAISIQRDWTLVDVGDVLIADGHVLNFETINPDTGKPCRMTLLVFFDGAANCPVGWEVMATENTQCISSAFRRACIALGKFPKVVYLDNGRAFRSKFFKGTKDFQQAGFLGLYRDLGCEVIHAWPYHGQSKTVERFFGTMHEMEVFLPSYTGNSIENKPARMHRGEDLHRKLYEKMGGRPLTLEETHTAIAKWFGQYADRPQRSTHLKGRTPFEVLWAGRGEGVDLERLNFLMLHKEVRTITKDGIKHLGRYYWDEALASRRHSILIYYDNVEFPHEVEVFDHDGNKICTARERGYYKIASGVHPAARFLGSDEQQEELKEAIRLKKGQEKNATAAFKVMLENVVKPEMQERMQALEIKKEVEEKPVYTAQKITQKEIAETTKAIAAAKAELAMPKAKPKPFFKDENARYDYLFKLLHEQGETLEESDVLWMEKMEQTPAFIRNCKRYYDQHLELYEFRRQRRQQG